MLFTSIEFAAFLTVVFLVYWLVLNRSLQIQNAFLLIAGYFFYGYWDWRFLMLLFALSLVNYVIGLQINRTHTTGIRKLWFLVGLFINIGVLGVFKYFNFFIDSFVDMVSVFGYHLSRSTTNIILPVGISFYVFLSLSYIIDIFRGNLKANRNIIEVLLTLSFFPIILAGPIQRPMSLLPQITRKRVFNHNSAVDGLRQILWGLFVKIAVADNIAQETDNIFFNIADYSGSTLLLGALLYTIQIYADFSGYSHIAIGTGRLFGFSLMQNFSYPYFARDISEFWKRWHISLTTWFRDYVFLPISFSLSSKISRQRILFIKTDLFIYIVASLVTWLLTGLWHGASNTFVVWGFLNGIFLILFYWHRKPRKQVFKILNISNKNKALAVAEGTLTFIVIVVFWIIFRSDSLSQSLEYITGILTRSLLTFPDYLPKTALVTTGLLIILEFIQRDKQHALQIERINNRPLRWVVYVGTVLIILFFGGGSQNFIYFQF